MRSVAVFEQYVGDRVELGAVDFDAFFLYLDFAANLLFDVAG